MVSAEAATFDAEAEQCEIDLARDHLHDFTTYTKPDYIENWFGEEVADACEQWLLDCIAGLSPRLMLFAPPRHGKSEIVSRRLPAFALGKFPDFWFVGGSYSPDLALEMSRDVKKIMAGDRYQNVFPETRLAGKGVPNSMGTRNTDADWELVGRDGTYRARGVGQPLSGFGAHGLVIDDPFKDLEDARSAAVRRKVWNWYAAVANLRLEPGGGLLLMHTRWHKSDLAGTLLKMMQNGQGDTFKVISYPALATHDEAHRKEGEALCPHRFPVEKLEKLKQIDSYVWSALYQQRPTVAGGQIYKAKDWRFWVTNPAAISDETTDLLLPRILYRRIYADTAMKTEEANDYSVFQAWGLGADGRIYLLDEIRDKWEAPELLTAAIAFWDKWQKVGANHERTQVMKIEDKASGTGLIQSLGRRGIEEGKRIARGAIPVEGIPRNRDKLIRANGATPHIRAGNVVLPRSAAWLSDFLQEASDFTEAMSHDHDDQLDPLCDAIEDLLGGVGDLYADAVT